VSRKRLALLIALVVLVVTLASSSASAVSDVDTSRTYSDISNNEITASQTEASNSSAGVTIRIMMTGVFDG
jgi:hypothetical protein